MGKEDKLVEHAKTKARVKYDSVVSAIQQMKENGEDINVSSVAQRAKCSRKYIYSQKELMDMITKERDQPSQRTEESKDAIIKALQIRVKELEKENKKLREMDTENTKKLCEELKRENRELREQLKHSYKF